MEEQLQIGQVYAKKAIIEEAAETMDFQAFCMGCVRRHRCGDWGDIQEDQKARNEAARKEGKEIRSEYQIPRIFNLGYAHRISVVTNSDRTETTIDFVTED